MTRIFSARVQGGVIVAEGVELPEGETVTVLLDSGGNTGNDLTPEEMGELVDAEVALDTGEGVPWEDVRAELYRKK